MFAQWPIRWKLIFSGVVLVVIVSLLAISGVNGVYAYRGLVRAISLRAAELPKATALVQSTGELRYLWKQERTLQYFSAQREFRRHIDEERFRMALLKVRTDLEDYKQQLDESSDQVAAWIGDNRRERQTVVAMESAILRIDHMLKATNWASRQLPDDAIIAELDTLHKLATALPSYLHTRMQKLRDEVRLKYRSLIVLVWSTSAGALLLLVLLSFALYRWVFGPLQTILEGSRRVASGDYGHRIQVRSHDEMGDLAQAMNNMTCRFQHVRDTLDRRVKLQTEQALRSAKMASVGVLAAGVAHEINNPMASVALCAESIEMRLAELREQSSEFNQWEEIETVERYLRTIQQEAFRCKEITDRLLDYSRKGSTQHVPSDLCELARGVVDMVQHSARSQKKNLRLECSGPVIAEVNGQEIKQVILNLVTNALEATQEGGNVEVVVSRDGDEARIIVTDDGCGMSEHVRQHLFEAFFTQRNSGQGTGLGLAITSRIIRDHGGTIEVLSDGPGKGSQFIVSLELENSTTARKPHERQSQSKAA